MTRLRYINAFWFWFQKFWETTKFCNFPQKPDFQNENHFWDSSPNIILKFLKYYVGIGNY